MALADMIAKASAEVGGKLNPDKRNKEQGYDYLSADKILTICGQALANAQIAVIPEIVDHSIAAIERQGKNPRLDAMVRFQFVVDGGENNKQSCTWIGYGSDYATPDKAVYKAITSGHKYFLMKLLNVGAGNEDAEHETEDEQPKRKPAAKPETQPTQPAQPAQSSGVMSLETAKEVKTSQGKRYGDMERDELTHVVNGIQKALSAPDLTPERREELTFKRDAALTILQS